MLGRKRLTEAIEALEATLVSRLDAIERRLDELDGGAEEEAPADPREKRAQRGAVLKKRGGGVLGPKQTARIQGAIGPKRAAAIEGSLGPKQAARRAQDEETSDDADEPSAGSASTA